VPAPTAKKEKKIKNSTHFPSMAVCYATAVGPNFHTPCIFCLRRTKERSIRTRPSTASPRSFLLSRRCRHQPTVVEGSEQMSLGRVRMLRSFVRRRQIMHGVWKFNNITPSHPSHAVDIFCARPSMAVGWCLPTPHVLFPFFGPTAVA
jgi:hypothetical protein